MAGAVGAWVTSVLGPQVLRWLIGVSFIAMALWMLVPDKLDDDEVGTAPRWGVFGTTVVAFFLAEMGDKTQIATVMLSAQYNAWLWVSLGTTRGMDTGQRARRLAGWAHHAACAAAHRARGISSDFSALGRADLVVCGVSNAASALL